MLLSNVRENLAGVVYRLETKGMQMFFMDILLEKVDYEPPFDRCSFLLWCERN